MFPTLDDIRTSFFLSALCNIDNIITYYKFIDYGMVNLVLNDTPDEGRVDNSVDPVFIVFLAARLSSDGTA